MHVSSSMLYLCISLLLLQVWNAMLSENLFVAAAKYHGTWTNVCCQRIKQRVDHVRQLIVPFSVRDTVHDTENLTFPRNSVVVPRGHPWIVVQNDADFRTGATELPCRQTQIFLAGGRGSSVWIRVENGRNQKANFVHNNRLKD